jgi:GLPGLI family protein
MRFFLLLCCLLSIPLTAQSISGSAIFETESASVMTFDTTSRISQQQQREINERMQKAMRKQYRLVFNASEGLYKQVPKLATPSAEKEVNVIGLGQGVDGGLYKDTKRGLLVETRDMFGKLFLIEDTLARPEWEILEEQKDIQGYTCYKAELPTKFGATTAWFTPDIPVNLGPGSYWGLPGFILQADNGRLRITCTELNIAMGEAAVVEPPTKGKSISVAEYKALYKKKIVEMQRMQDKEGDGR